MTPQKYEHLTELFHAALAIAPHERAIFLDQLSDDDDGELRRELESLLAAHEQRAGYTQKPPDDIAAGMYLAEQDNGPAGAASHAPHTRIDRYEIHSLLGKGGMGEVYLAEDTTLRRLVALKLLPAAAAANEDRMRRFVQEAKAAAALSHPHIAQIFEVGEHEGTHFIAMELVDGVTLSTKIHTEHTDLRKLLKYLQQVAEGLAKAHAAGIVHRDLKPDNIMITRDDYAKILDFGLAKLVETERALGLGSAPASEIGTRITAQQSLAGMVMGTAGYMSPEQAQGKVKEIDQRSDIFSFGCILFEAATAHKPFEGQDLLDSLHKIVHAPTPQIKDTNANAPDELQRIVRRCLAKDPDERYQTIKDVTLELKEVRQGMAVPAEVDTTVPPSGNTETLGRQTTEQSAKSTSSAEYLVSQIKSHKRSAAIALAALVIAAAVLAYFSYFKHKRAPLTEQDTILIADFDNKTGDEIFDGALKQALAVQLEQSPFLNIFPDERIQQTLRLMGRMPDVRVTRDVAREICERQGLKAMLVGSIAPLGSHYVIALEVVNALTGDVLAREQVEAESKEQVLSVLGKSATRLREKLGESLSTIQKFDAPAPATTSSLEALKNKAASTKLSAQGKNTEAISLLKRAVELDPQFASGYAGLATISQNIGQGEAARAFATKAFELRERASEPERLWIIAQYYLSATGELEKAIETLESSKQTYPRQGYTRNRLANTFSFFGQHEKAVEEMQEAVRLDPNNPLFYRNLARQLRYLGRFQEAKSVLERASAQKLETPVLHLERYVNAFLRGDAGEMQSQMEWFRAKPDEPFSLGLQTAVAEVAGQYRKARGFREQWVELSKRRNHEEAAAGNAAGDAQTDALSGRCELVRQEADRSLAIARTPSTLRTVALALALCGELGQAQSLADEYARMMPMDTLANGVDLPVIRAALANHRGNYAQAIELLKTARRYEHPEFFRVPLDLDQFAAYLRGQAFLGQHSGAGAAAEFQYILDHRGLAPFSLLCPLAQLGLARAAVLNGDTAKARQAYQNFFGLWKDADADLPVLIEAKKEYEKLK